MFFYKMCCRVHLLCVGIYPEELTKRADYTKYLGKNYENESQNSNVSTIVCNH